VVTVNIESILNKSNGVHNVKIVEMPTNSLYDDEKVREKRTDAQADEKEVGELQTAAQADDEKVGEKRPNAQSDEKKVGDEKNVGTAEKETGTENSGENAVEEENADDNKIVGKRNKEQEETNFESAKSQTLEKQTELLKQLQALAKRFDKFQQQSTVQVKRFVDHSTAQGKRFDKLQEQSTAQAKQFEEHSSAQAKRFEDHSTAQTKRFDKFQGRSTAQAKLFDDMKSMLDSLMRQTAPKRINPSINCDCSEVVKSIKAAINREATKHANACEKELKQKFEVRSKLLDAENAKRLHAHQRLKTKHLQEEKRLKEWEHRLIQESKCVNESELRSLTKIKLDVGGKRFSTSLTTLRCADEGSVLAAMFSGRFSLKKDADGYFFIDRNGTVFEYILSFLRDGAQKAPILESLHVAKLVLREARYFGLTSLSSVIYLPALGLKNFTSILRPEHHKKVRAELLTYAKKDWNSFSLMYSASRDGFAASTFHKMCDSRGPSVVVVQSQSGAVLVGYAMWSWGTNPSHTKESQSFLTRLHNPKGEFALASWSVSNWDLDHAQCGPRFGSQGLIISSGCLYERVGKRSSSTSVKNCVFHGKKFCLKDYEVYLIIQD